MYKCLLNFDNSFYCLQINDAAMIVPLRWKTQKVGAVQWYESPTSQTDYLEFNIQSPPNMSSLWFQTLRVCYIWGTTAQKCASSAANICVTPSEHGT